MERNSIHVINVMSPKIHDNILENKVICPYTENLGKSDIKSQTDLLYQMQTQGRDFSFRRFTDQMHLKEEYPEDCNFIRTKFPIWSQRHKSWTINSYGRMKLASKRNFQLMYDKDEEKNVIFQMGKIKVGEFIVDYSYPFSFVQAMGIALSTHNWLTNNEQGQI